MLLLLAVSIQPACASDNDKKNSLPSINMTVMGSLGGGTDRTYALGPHDSALILEKFGDQYKVVGEIGGGVYHLMGQEVDLTKVKYFESFGITEDDINQFYRNRREALRKWKDDQCLKQQNSSGNAKTEKLTQPKTTKKNEADTDYSDENNTGKWKDVDIKLNPNWEAKHSEALKLAMEKIANPSDPQVEHAKELFLALSNDKSFSKWEATASMVNAANILYLQRNYREAEALYRKAMRNTENESGNYISRVSSKLLSNTWKANRASKLSDLKEKPLPITWVKITDVNHGQEYFRGF